MFLKASILIVAAAIANAAVLPNSQPVAERLCQKVGEYLVQVSDEVLSKNDIQLWWSQVASRYNCDGLKWRMHKRGGDFGQPFDVIGIDVDMKPPTFGSGQKHIQVELTFEMRKFEQEPFRCVASVFGQGGRRDFLVLDQESEDQIGEQVCSWVKQESDAILEAYHKM